MVETDEYGQSLLRCGNSTNGIKLPDGAEVHCTYQVGYGPDGNIGSDSLIYFDALAFPRITSCWNPIDVTNGRAPEPVAEIIRRAPEAYRYRQLRAVTLQDYVDRAEELLEVSKAAARYAWTGSWRTVQIAIDPVGTTTLTPELRQRIAEHLNAVRLIGEDLEIRAPRFVPLDIQVTLCIHPDYWIDDIRFLLEQEFSEGYTPDGRRGFFHPDRWTFGQKLRASEIIGRIQRIKGVDHVVSVSMKRWNEVSSGTDELAEVRINEIIQVRNDPDHMEDGFMTLTIGGGRQ
jgi:predicted phage baseplate assembly protein